MHSVGFIGLGNVGGKLAGSLLRNKCDVMVRDLDRDVAAPFLEAGAKWADSPKAMVEACNITITFLPSPAACATVMEADDGVLARPKRWQNLGVNKHNRCCRSCASWRACRSQRRQPS